MSTPGGDPYFPDFGSRAYAVLHYDLSLDYRVESNRLDARAEISARAEEDLAELELDLRGLEVRKVRLDGRPVERFKQRRGKLFVRPRTPLRRGAGFTVAVRYAGQPRPIPDGEGGMGWEELSDGVLVAGQTNGAPSWFPCNDRPDDKATYRIEITAGSAYHVVANGELVHRSSGPATTTWHYEQREPMATYLATVQIGRYVARHVADAPVPVTAVLSADRLEDFSSGFGRQADMVEFFSERFGRYPFHSYTVVITDDPLEIPLEAEALSVFGSNFLTDDWDAVRLVAHELAHQWFGNSLTAASWRDIWLHEGFACYAEWLWSEESGGPTATERARHHWHRLDEAPQDLVLSDPGPEDMFDDRVYKRGACLLHALRVRIGDESFWSLLQEWVRRHEYGSVTTGMFVALAEEVSGERLQSFFDQWLHQRSLPPLPCD